MIKSNIFRINKYKTLVVFLICFAVSIQWLLDCKTEREEGVVLTTTGIVGTLDFNKYLVNRNKSQITQCSLNENTESSITGTLKLISWWSGNGFTKSCQLWHQSFSQYLCYISTSSNVWRLWRSIVQCYACVTEFENVSEFYAHIFMADSHYEK